MRRTLSGSICALVFALTVGPVGPAHARNLDFTATLSIEVDSLPAATFHASGTADSQGSGGSFTLPANLFSGTVSLPPSVFTGMPQIKGLKVVVAGNGPGGFEPDFSPPDLHPDAVWLEGGGVGGAMALDGDMGINVLMLFTANYPLSAVGAGSTASSMQGALVNGVTGTQWTTRQAAVLGEPWITGQGAVFSQVLLTTSGNDQRTSMGAGPITLVSPVRIHSIADGHVAAIARLTVVFEEPVVESEEPEVTWSMSGYSACGLLGIEPLLALVALRKRKTRAAAASQ